MVGVLSDRVSGLLGLEYNVPDLTRRSMAFGYCNLLRSG
jgi:hypothetical protein